MGKFHNLPGQASRRERVGHRHDQAAHGCGGYTSGGTAGGTRSTGSCCGVGRAGRGGRGLLVALPLLRRRAGPAVAEMASAAPATRDGLVDALARLDLAHEAGQLSEAAYQDQRLHRRRGCAIH